MNALFKNQTTLKKTAYIETALSSNKTIVSIILFHLDLLVQGMRLIQLKKIF